MNFFACKICIDSFPVWNAVCVTWLECVGWSEEKRKKWRKLNGKREREKKVIWFRVLNMNYVSFYENNANDYDKFVGVVVHSVDNIFSLVSVDYLFSFRHFSTLYSSPNGYSNRFFSHMFILKWRVCITAARVPRCATMNIMPSQPKKGFYYHSHNFLPSYYHHYRHHHRRRLCDCCCCWLCWRFVYNVVNGVCNFYKIENKLQNNKLIINASESPQNMCLCGQKRRGGTGNTQVNEKQTYTTFKRTNIAIFCFHFNFTFACFLF